MASLQLQIVKISVTTTCNQALFFFLRRAEEGKKALYPTGQTRDVRGKNHRLESLWLLDSEEIAD